ncbi:zf-HC2 domain-containing protein, partial [Candidatus Zixiibacteriota bacterium]
MKHPDPSDLLDHRKGELQAEHAREIEFHLELCDACRSEWEAIGTLERCLDDWKEVDSNGEAAKVIIRRLDREGVIPTGSDHAGGRSPNLPRWFRRAVLATAAVAATLLFQAMVWNPLGEPAPFRAIVSLTTPAYAMSSTEAMPDTILVLTLHHDETMSTPVMPGRFQIADMVEGLIDLLEPGEYSEILVVGSDADHPVTFSTSDLDPLTEAIGIDSVTFGEGIVAIERIRNENYVHINVPIETVSRSLHVRRVISDSLLRAIALEVRADSVDVVMVASLDSLWTRALEIRVTPHQLRIEPDIRVRVNQAVEIEPQRVVLHIRESIRSMIDSLTVPIQAVLTVNDAGLVLMDRAAVPIEEVEDALRRLKDLNPEITLLILIPEDSGEDDAGYLLVKIANELGIEKISIKKVKRDDPS